MTRFIQTTTSCVGVGSSVLLSLRPPCVTTIVLCFSFIRSCRHFDSASVWCILALALMLTALIFYNKYKKIANKQVELHNHVGVQVKHEYWTQSQGRSWTNLTKKTPKNNNILVPSSSTADQSRRQSLFIFESAVGAVPMSHFFFINFLVHYKY